MTIFTEDRAVLGLICRHPYREKTLSLCPSVMLRRFVVMIMQLRKLKKQLDKDIRGKVRLTGGGERFKWVSNLELSHDIMKTGGKPGL